jgi:glycosyltransferase involved in cell wall biosynthesis
MENSGPELSAQESQKARLTHWPQTWGERPQPGGEGYLWLAVPPKEPAHSHPLVSVVVPTRNRPDFLCRALQSILAQTYPAIEILVVNDGGVDVQELITCVDRNGMIRYFNLPKTVERSAARNLALCLARGHYIAYLDDDDRYYPNHVATLVNHLQKTGSQVAYTVARRVTADVVDGAVQVTEADIPFALDYNPQRLLIENYIPILCLMHERSLLEKSGLFDEGLTRLEDWELWIRFSQQTHFEYIPAVTCEFTRHAGDSTNAPANTAYFLASCKEIFRRYAHLAQDRQDLQQWQRKVIYHKTCYVYDALMALLESHLIDSTLPRIEQLYNECMGDGISATHLESALALALARQHQGEQSIHLLQRALLADNNNFRAREALVDRLIQLKNYREATQQLEILLAANPGCVRIQGTQIA